MTSPAAPAVLAAAQVIQLHDGSLNYTPTPWTCLVYETVTGRIVDELAMVGSPRYSRILNQPGDGTVTVDVNERPASVIRDYIAGWRFSLALMWGDHAMQAGPIVAHDDPDDGSGTITVGFVGLWQLLNRRLLKATGYTSDIVQPAADLSFTASLHTIAKRVIVAAMADPYCSLPIVLPEDIAGDNVRNYTAYELVMAGERLADLTKVDDGPDIDFAPRRSADGTRIEHAPRIGNPLLGGSGAPWTWDYNQSLVSLPTRSDWAKMAFRVWTKGNGTEYATPVGYAEDNTLPQAGWPQLDLATSYSSETNTAVLDSYSQGQVMLHGRPVATWSATVLNDPGETDDFPRLSEITPGGTGIFGVTGHRTVPDGDYSWRVLGLSDGGAPHLTKLLVADQLMEV